MDTIRQLTALLPALQKIAGIAPDPNRSIKVNEIIASYAAFKAPKCRVKGWKSTYARLCNVEREWGDRSPLDLTYDDSDAYIAKRVKGGASRSTAGQDLQALTSALNWAVKRSKLSYNPLAGYEFDLGKKKRDRIYTDKEIDMLLEGARRAGCMQVHVVITIMRHSGIRPKELLHSLRSSVDWETGRLHIPAEIAKTGTARFVALRADALSILKKLPDSRWLIPAKDPLKACPYTTLNGQWHKALDVSCVKLNPDGTKPELYSLRATLATRLALDHGFETSQLCAALGWENEGEARTYVRAGERQVMELAARTEGRKPPLSIRPMARVNDSVDTGTSRSLRQGKR